MTYREHFHAIMHYEGTDRMPVVHWTGWPETMERWYAEGLPRDANVHEFFGTTPHWGGIHPNLNLYPQFDQEVVEDTPEYRIVRGGDGVLMQDWKDKSCIPHYIDFTLKEADDWPEYKKRLQPDPARLPKDLDQVIDSNLANGLPVSIGTASMMGWIRNWMGVENLSYLMMDEPDCFAEMVDTLADLTCWAIDEIMPRCKEKGLTPDFGFGWEDICGRSGPLVSPSIFRQCVAPGYRKMRNKLEQWGIPLLGIDSDGDIKLLCKDWLDAGVNLQFPIEVGPWKGDGNDYRKTYGRELRIIGNFDKLTLERSQEEVLAEFARLRPLMQDGGFLMMPDHLITPGVSLEMYQWYLDQVRNYRF